MPNASDSFGRSAVSLNFADKRLVNVHAQLQLLGVDINQPLISKIERNRRFVKDYELACLCQVLQVSERDLLADFYNATE